MGANVTEQWPASLDAMVAAPAHHEVLLENERVRVLDTRLRPGALVKYFVSDLFHAASSKRRSKVAFI